MQKLIRTNDFQKSFDRYDGKGDVSSCVVCGRPVKVKIGSKLNLIYLDNDYLTALTPDEAEKMPNNMGAFPIGPDCLKKNIKLKSYVVTVIWDGA